MKYLILILILVGCAQEMPKVYLAGLDAEEALIEFHGVRYILNCHSYGVKVYELDSGKYLRTLGKYEISSFGSAFVYNDAVYLVTSEAHNVSIFRTTDLINVERFSKAIEDDSINFFNTSVTQASNGHWYMAYEVVVPIDTFFFLESEDLITWKPIGKQFSSKYTACPFLNYQNGYFYVTYLSPEQPGHESVYITVVARSKDLITWEYSKTPVLVPGPGEGINASDMDAMVSHGDLYISYFTGDQGTWGNIKIKIIKNTTFAQFFESFF